jgi:dihydroxyacid dehydratase/phosphogluconate dehydratase
MHAHCHHCDKITPTVFITLSTGHIGNLCAYCKTARKGRPYVSREFVKANTLKRAEGNHHELQAHAARH